MTTIFVPGIKGSKLADVYPTDFDVRWSIEDFTVGNVFENPLDFELIEGKYEKADEHVFREWELVNFAYGQMIKRLRKRVSPRLYTFPYDWRKPIEYNARRLARMIERVLNRLDALDEEDPAVSFVTHSMGGLVLRSALGLRDEDPLEQVSRIVFIAPPFRGSAAIPEVLVKGQKDGLFGAEKNFRKLARGFVSVYQLIPSYEGAAVDAEDRSNLDLFDIDNWQENVRESSLREDFLSCAEHFVRGADPEDGPSEAPMISEDLLRENSEDILVLMGTGHETLSSIPVLTKNEANRNWFDFEKARKDEAGDGQVLLKSAAIEGITLAAYRGTNEHGLVCRDNLIIKSVEKWLNDDPLPKMKPRTADDPVDRPIETSFDAWDGTTNSFTNHIPGD